VADGHSGSCASSSLSNSDLSSPRTDDAAGFGPLRSAVHCYCIHLCSLERCINYHCEHACCLGFLHVSFWSVRFQWPVDATDVHGLGAPRDLREHRFIQCSYDLDLLVHIPPLQPQLSDHE